MRGQLHSASDVLDSVLGGKSTLTIVSRKTGVRYTYKFNRPPGDDPSRCVWVKVLVGSDNETSYKYLGVLWPKDMVFRPKGSGGEPIAWMVNTLRERPAALLDAAEVWHEGTCARCGRKLTVPESIASGFGPECRKLRS